MNFLALESKFRELERKEDEVRNYFDPRTTGGKKHYFIKDLKADLQYDNLMYGFSRYLEDSSEAEVKPDTAPIPVSFSPPRTGSNPRTKTAATTKRVFAKRKQPEIFEMKEPVNKDRYIGLFSATKIMKPEILEVKEDRFGDKKDVWKTTAMDVLGVSNPAAKQRVTLLDRKVRTATAQSPMRDTQFNELTSSIRARTSKTAKKSDSGQMESLSGLQLEVDSEREEPAVKEVATQKTNSIIGTPRRGDAVALPILNAEGRGSQLSEESDILSLNVEMVKKTDHEWELYSKGESQGTYTTLSAQQSDRRPLETDPRFPAISEESLRTPKSVLDQVSEVFDEIPLVKIKLLPHQISRKTKSYSVVLTDISDPAYFQEIKAGLLCDESGFVLSPDSGIFDPLKSLSWVTTPRTLLGKTLRMQVFGIGLATVKLIDRFLHFGQRDEDGERQIQQEIRAYEDYLKDKLGLERPELSPRVSDSPAKSKSVHKYLSDMIDEVKGLGSVSETEIPQALFRLPDTVRPLKKVTPAQIEGKMTQSGQSHVTLSMGGGFYSVSKPHAGPVLEVPPFSEQRAETHIEGFILQPTHSTDPQLKNPMTSALYKFRSEANAFKPETYSANLSIFEAQDMLEERYGGRKQKTKAKKEAEDVILGVAGKGFRA